VILNIFVIYTYMWIMSIWDYFRIGAITNFED